MSHLGGNRREYGRHEYEQKVFFDFIYDFQTKVDFEPSSKDSEVGEDLKFNGVTRNVSAHGLCFSSSHELQQGSKVHIKVYLPDSDEFIMMLGEVRWNKIAAVDANNEKLYATGIKLISIEGKDVEETIYFDEKYQVYWGSVLEKLLGEYRLIQQEKLNEEDDES